MQKLHRLSEHADRFQEQLDILKRQQDSLQREVGQKWYWGAEELTRLGIQLATVDTEIHRLELMMELLVLQQEQIRNDNALLGPDSFKKFQTQYRIESIEAELAQMDAPARSRRITASAGGDSGGKAVKAVSANDWEDVDWEKMAAAGDNLAFARSEDAFIAGVRAEVVKRLDLGQEPRVIHEWYQASILPCARHILELASALTKSADESQVFHDIRNRLLDLILNVPVLLQTGQVALVRASCQPPTNSLRSVVQHLQSRFALNVSLLQVNMTGLRLAPHVDVDAFMAIMVNLVGNAADHPAPGKKVTRVKLELIQGMLVVDDKGAGMEEEALENLRAGIRIHNGERVAAEDAANEHGFGWQIVRENAAKLGVELELDSEPGHGSTVLLILPDGFVEADPLEYVLMGRIEEDQLRNIVLETSAERRHEIVVEMNLLSERIMSQHMTRLWDLVLDEKSITHFQDHVRRIGERYTTLLQIMMEGLNPNDSAVRTAVWQAELLRAFLQPRK
jgi:signal transduction histidine kinase